MWNNVASSAQAQCQVQRMFQIAAYKAQMETRGVTLSYQQLAELYSAKVKVSAGEQVTQTFVGSAMRVFSQLLSEPTVRGLILQACLKLSSDMQCASTMYLSV